MRTLRTAWYLLTLKPAGMPWRRWWRLNRAVQRGLRARRLDQRG